MMTSALEQTVMKRVTALIVVIEDIQPLGQTPAGRSGAARCRLNQGPRKGSSSPGR